MRLPGWLIHRARLGHFARAYVLLPPASPRSAAIYLLESDPEAAGGPAPIFELHAVADAESGVDGATIPLTRRELHEYLLTLAGVMSGRLETEALVFAKPTTDAPAGEPVTP